MSKVRSSHEKYYDFDTNTASQASHMFHVIHRGENDM